MDQNYIEKWRRRVESMAFYDLREEYEDWTKDLDDRLYFIGRDAARCGGEIDEKLRAKMEYAQEDLKVCDIMWDLLHTKYKKEWSEYLRWKERDRREGVSE